MERARAQGPGAEAEAGPARSGETSAAASRKAKPWVERLARFGYLAKGAVYCLVGVLACGAAIGVGGETTGTKGALHSLASQPFGQVLLVLVAVGLAGYVIWRLVQATVDPENNGTDTEGILQRLGYGAIALSYAGLAVSAAAITIGSGGDSSGGTTNEGLTAQLMAQPFGRWLVGLAGVIVVGAGIFQLYYGVKTRFLDKLKKSEMSNTEITWAKRAGVFGLGARGVVLALIGAFLIQAALSYDPEKAGGLGEALAALERQPQGPWLLGCVALGLVAYGVYSGLLARYRRIYF